MDANLISAEGLLVGGHDVPISMSPQILLALENFSFLAVLIVEILVNKITVLTIPLQLVRRYLLVARLVLRRSSIVRSQWVLQTEISAVLHVGCGHALSFLIGGYRFLESLVNRALFDGRIGWVQLSQDRLGILLRGLASLELGQVGPEHFMQLLISHDVVLKKLSL